MYRFATTREDFRDLASGLVAQSRPGFPAFPVRLASELFQRAASHAPDKGRLTIWDPCCGSGYLATVVGLLHREKLDLVLASDISAEAIELAGRNLALLTLQGLRARALNAAAQVDHFAKSSYAEAAAAAGRLAQKLSVSGGDLPHAAFRADIFDRAQLAEVVRVGPAPDVVIADVPYGIQTSWSGAQGPSDPLSAAVCSLGAVLPGHTVMAIVARARKVVIDSEPHVLERLRVGNRSAIILRVADVQACR